LRGTKYDFNTENTILFIEDLGEYYYHIDRIIQNFRLGNKFAGVRAIILGGFSEMKENIIPFGQSIEEIVREAVLPLKIPVIPNFQAGHINPNNPIMLGCKVELKSEKESMRIKFN
jgi:muramoyltetrapeptide carboxypeptidase